MKINRRICLGVLICVLLSTSIPFYGENIDFNKDVGEIAYSSSITASGAMSISIPIECYQNENIFSPNVNLCYNSQDGIGPMGIGWSISCGSVISRTNKSYYYNGNTDAIKRNSLDNEFLLNGQHLILTKDSTTQKEYQTEQGFIKAICYLRDDHSVSRWMVYYPNGTEELFSTTSNYTDGQNYYVNERKDVKGRYIKFFYYPPGSNGHVRISSIKYGNGFNNPISVGQIRFNYTDMADNSIELYKDGTKVVYDYLLTSIQTYYKENLLRTYNLSYTNHACSNLLTQIDCSSNGHSFNPLRFNYGQNNQQSLTSTDINGSFYRLKDKIDSTDVRQFTSSFGKDGTTLITYKMHDAYNWDHGSGNTTKYKIFYGLPASSQLYVCTNLDSGTISSTIPAGNGFIELLGANIDGVPGDEIIKVNNVIEEGNDKIIFSIYKKNSTGTLQQTCTKKFCLNNPITRDIYTNVTPKSFFTGNFTGRGKQEVLVVSSVNPMGVPRSSICSIIDLACDSVVYSDNAFDFVKRLPTYHNGDRLYSANDDNNFSDKLIPFDYNGDGKTDLLLIGEHDTHIYSFAFSEEGEIVCNLEHIDNSITRYTFRNLAIITGDFNGDGNTDLLSSPHVGNYMGSDWDFYISKGNGTFQITTMPINLISGKNHFSVQDINLDGRTDIIISGDDMIKAFIMNGVNVVTSYSTTTNSPSMLVPTNASNQYAIYNMLSLYKNGNIKKLYLNGNSISRLLISSITSSLGKTDSFVYNTAEENTSFFTIGDNATYPYQNYCGPLQICTCTTSSYNGILSKVKYRYVNPIVNLQGKGFMGFTEIFSTDSISGLSSHTICNPLNNSVPVSYEDNGSLSTYEYNVAYNGKLMLITNTSTTTLDKATNNEVTTTTSYNEVGNPITQHIEYADGNYMEVTSRYTNSTSIGEYLLGQKTYECRDTYRSSGRRRAWDNIYYDRGLVIRSNTFDSSRLGQHLYEYDAFNRLTKVRTTKGPANRYLDQTFTYNNDDLIESTTDCLGNTENYFYDAYGRINRTTDVAGNNHCIEYDTWGRETSSTSPDGVVQTNHLEWCNGGDNAVFRSINTSTCGPTTIIYYDILGREIKNATIRFNGDTLFVNKYYDNRGQLISESLPYKSAATHFNTYTYDEYGRPILISSPTGNTESFEYNGLSTTSIIEGISKTKTVNCLGDVISISDPTGNIVYDYNSNGLVSSITTPEGIMTSLTYDSYRRRTGISDPSSGTSTTNYDSRGNITSEIDADGNVVSYSYDSYDRLTQKTAGDDVSATYSYDNFGNLLSVTNSNGTGTVYSYDNLLRISSVRETGLNNTWLQKDYAYDNGNVKSIVFTNQDGVITTENYRYANGYLVKIFLPGEDSISINANHIYAEYPSYQKTQEDEQGNTTSFIAGPLTHHRTFDELGRISNIRASTHLAMGRSLPQPILSTTVFDNSYSYNSITGNLIGRQNSTRQITENFAYDGLNRLITAGNDTISYSDNGNIIRRSTVGSFEYSESKPYALEVADFTSTHIPAHDQQITYNSLCRPETILENGYTMAFDYDVDGNRQRWILSSNGTQRKGKVYLGDRYEGILTSNSSKEIFYVGGDAYSANIVLVKENRDQWKRYSICRDNLGSICNIYDDNNRCIQELSFDAWGNIVQIPGVTASRGELFLDRGFTGHEHLQDFGLINMNARLYDPSLGRFLSPDPLIQTPENSQNFNRYSYCLNNPLKYTDDSGEFWNLALGGLIGGIFNWASHGGEFNWDGLKYFGVGAVAGAVGAGLSSGINVTFANGNFWAGALGTAKGVASTGFISGAVSGASAGLSGGFITGAGNSWLGGSSFINGLKTGFIDGAIGALSGGLGGGIYGGLDAITKGTNFWTGTTKFDLSGAYSCANCDFSDFQIPEPITGKYVGDYEGQHVFESKLLGKYSDEGGYRGITFPEKGIFVGKGVFTGNSENGRAMMQHEFGHVLQYRIVGAQKYYSIIAKESLKSALKNPTRHDTFWTETWANYLAKQYFGKIWHGVDEYSRNTRLRYYPAKNIDTLFFILMFGK